MKKILLHLQKEINALSADYADVRFVALDRVRVRAKDGALDEVKETKSTGIGFRVLKDGAFGFSATGDLSEASLRLHLRRALEMAKRFSVTCRAEIKLAPVKPARDRWQTPVRKDPWGMPLRQKLKPLLEAQKELKSHAWVETANGLLDFTRKRVTFISTDGSWIEQTHYRTGGWIYGESRLGSERIRRSWPGPSGAYRAQGYEAIEHAKFEREAVRLARELKELSKSPEAPTGTFDLILKGSILALQIHETFGHASEADRIYGYEDNFGGRTFLNPGLLGGFPVASKEVTIVSDAGLDLGPGAGGFAYDDEGVKAKRFEVIRKGVFWGHLTNREIALFLNQTESSASSEKISKSSRTVLEAAASSANMVAEDWSHYPLIRMTNLSLLPGTGSLAEMIRDVKEGFILDSESSWSIDDMRLDFQIGGEAGYHIRNGKITGLVRFPFYHGNTLDFWRSCDAVAGKKEWDFWGFPDCGKGGPYQEAFTGHGLSPARFRNVRFGRD